MINQGPPISFAFHMVVQFIISRSKDKGVLLSPAPSSCYTQAIYWINSIHYFDSIKVSALSSILQWTAQETSLVFTAAMYKLQRTWQTMNNIFTCQQRHALVRLQLFDKDIAPLPTTNRLQVGLVNDFLSKSHLQKEYLQSGMASQQLHSGCQICWNRSYENVISTMLYTWHKIAVFISL